MTSGAAPPPISTRALDDGDVDRVLELMRAALGEPRLLRRTPELFAWKHFLNPFGRSIAMVAESGGRIVGLRAFMRWDLLTVDGPTLRCVRAVDTATHPDFQRRGIFRRLTSEALEQAAEAGIDMVFNTPNEKSGAGYVSMGWVPVGPIGVLVRPSWRLLGGAQRETGVPVDPHRFLSTPEPVVSGPLDDRAPLGLRTPRSESYFRWRFTAHPTARYYQVNDESAIAVVRPNIRKGRRELILADVYGSPERAIPRVVRKSQAAYLAAWFSRGTPERRAAMRNGLVPIPGVTPLTLMVRPLRELGLDVTSISSWDLSVADLELL